jgi:hypothetical protein
MDDPSREPGTIEEIPEGKALSERRKFLKRAGKVALTAPAVALLLSAQNKSAQARPLSGFDAAPG